MNTVNASTNFSGFQLHLGRAPRVIPPLIPTNLDENLIEAGTLAANLLSAFNNDITEARDNLLHVKIQQAHHCSGSRAPDPNYKIGDLVMMSTLNRRHEYKKKGDQRAAKFFP